MLLLIYITNLNYRGVTLNTNLKKPFIIMNTMLIFFVITCISGSMYVFALKDYQQQLDENAQRVVEQVGALVDSRVLEQVYKIPNLFFVDSGNNLELRQPMIKKLDTYGVNILDIKRKINGIKGLNEYILSMDIYYELNDLLIVDGNMVVIDDQGKLSSPLPRWFNYVDNMVESFFCLPNNYEDNLGKEVLSFVYNIPYGPQKYNTYLTMNMDKEGLVQMMESLNGDKDQKTLLLVNNEGETILSTEKRVGMDEAFILKVFSQLQLDTGNAQTFDYGNEKFLVSATPSQYNEWYYLSIVKQDYLYQMSQLLVVVFLVPGFLGLFSICVAILLNNWLYKPMEKVFSFMHNLPSEHQYHEAEEINEYERITTTVTTLIDEVEVLQDQLVLNEPAIYHSNVQRILNGNRYVSVGEDIKEAHIQLKDPFCFCFTVQIQGEDNDELLAVEYAILQDMKAIEEYTIAAIVVADEVIGFINFNDLHSEALIISQVQDIINAHIDGRDYTIATGKHFAIDDGNRKNFKAGTETAYEALRYSYLYYSKPFLSYEDLKINQLKEQGSNLEYIQKIEEAIRGGNKQHILKAIGSLKEQMLTGEYTIHYCLNVLRDLTASIRRVFISMGLRVDQVLQDDIREVWKDKKHIEDYCQWLIHTISVLQEKQSNQLEDESQILLQQIKSIVNENVFDELSLDYVADQVNMRYDTLSRRFKQMTGQTFSQYVKSVKLEHAVELVLSNEYTMAEISQKLGYSSAHYFIQIFKKSYGITPKQYQLKMLKEGKGQKKEAEHEE